MNFHKNLLNIFVGIKECIHLFRIALFMNLLLTFNIVFKVNFSAMNGDITNSIPVAVCKRLCEKNPVVCLEIPTVLRALSTKCLAEQAIQLGFLIFDILVATGPGNTD